MLTPDGVVCLAIVGGFAIAIAFIVGVSHIVAAYLNYIDGR